MSDDFKDFTYRDPRLSLWQSAVQTHIRSPKHKAKLAAASLAGDTSKIATEHDLMLPVHLVGHTAKAVGKPFEVLAHAVEKGFLDIKAKFDPLSDCAKSAANFLKAEVEGDEEASKLYQGQLDKAVCDVAGWTECLATYIGYKLLLKSPQYRQNQNVVVDLGTRSRFAIIGDWGVGDAVATNVLKQVAVFKPDLLIHLGDVYYSGTQIEVKANFLDICRSVLGDIPIYTLCGNHDMYSGGQGYYWLLDQIGQKSSYFCLQNNDWMFLAMDTGFNDRDPLTVNTNMTKLVSQGEWSEAAWHLNQISKLGTRKLVLLSHHQLFSPFGSVGSIDDTPYAYNPNLYDVFGPILSKVRWWFWGHEHTLGIYPPYMDLKRGRCVGASAVPVFSDQQSYDTKKGLKRLNDGDMPKWDPNGELSATDDTYNNCFAIMTLNGASATVDYYEVPPLQPSRPFKAKDVEPAP